MRIMAVDYGDARTGLAVSDVTRTLTGDVLVILSKNMKETAQRIAKEAIVREVSCIIIGYPKNMDGSIGESAMKSERLCEAVKEICDVEIKLWDERLTTKDAHRILTEAGKRGKKRKNTVDAVAASLILESYLRSL